jgi:hypothetical protein
MHSSAASFVLVALFVSLTKIVNLLIARRLDAARDAL